MRERLLNFLAGCRHFRGKLQQMSVLMPTDETEELFLERWRAAQDERPVSLVVGDDASKFDEFLRQVGHARKRRAQVLVIVVNKRLASGDLADLYYMDGDVFNIIHGTNRVLKAL